MKKLLAFCCCISAATPVLAQPVQPSEYNLKLSPQEAGELGKGIADKVKDAQALLALVQRLQQQLDAQNKAVVAPAPAPVPEEAKP